MAAIHEVAGVLLGFVAPMVGFVAFAIRAQRDRILPSSRAAEELAAARGWLLEPIEGDERVAALAAFGLGEQTSPAAIWKAPDATFTALTLRARGREFGLVVATPHGTRRHRPEIGEMLRRHHHRDGPARVNLPGDLSSRSPGVEACRVGERLVVWRPGVEDAESLEGLVMAACAILDA